MMESSRERAAFTLSAAIKSELEKAVPKSKRSRFVEQAIADALMERARQKARDAIRSAPAYPVRGGDSIAALHRIRAERDRDLVHRSDLGST